MGTNTAETARRPNKFREFLLWATAGTLGTWATTQWSPAASGILAAALGAFVFLRLTERVVIKQISAWRTIGVFWLAMMFAIQGWSAYARQGRLTAMERASPAAYLSYIKRTQEDSFWLMELKRLDPEAFEAEFRRREQARAEQEDADADRPDEPEPEAIAEPTPQKDRKVSGADDNLEATANLVGRWCDKTFPGSDDGNIEIAIVTAADGKSERLRLFFDGSRSRDPLKFRGNAFWHVGSSSGDHYKIASTGELQLFDEEGFIRMAFPVARGHCVKN